MERLTDRQKEVFDILTLLGEVSIGFIAEEIGNISRQSIYERLLLMEKKGFVKRNERGTFIPTKAGCSQMILEEGATKPTRYKYEQKETR